MTRDDILKMEAGREMDALIAEKVMGWKWFTNPNESNIRYFRPIDKFRYGGIEADSKKGYTLALPKYSTDITAALEVQEKMASLGYYFSLDYDLCAWTATFSNTSGKLISVNTTKSNPSEEICRAALLAVMETE
jgi:hypothetical protein